MNRLDYAAHILGFLRQQKTPPISRLAVVAAAAACGPEGGSIRQICEKINEPDRHGIGGWINKLQDRGYLTRIPGSNPIRYTPTPLALEEIAPLIKPAPAATTP